MGEFLHIFLLLGGTLGATFIINFSYLFKPLRTKVSNKSKFWGKLLGCPQCLGFWIGLIAESTLMLKMNIWQNLEWGDLYHILFGFITSIFCYTVYLLIKPLMDKYD